MTEFGTADRKETMSDLIRRIQQAQRNAGEAAVIAHLEESGLVEKKQPPGLVPIEDHNRLTAGPSVWASTRIAADQFQMARGVFGCQSEDDDKRLYRALQAYEWRRTQTVSPYDADLSHL